MSDEADVLRLKTVRCSEDLEKLLARTQADSYAYGVFYSALAAQNACERFSQWAGNMGAFLSVASMASLAARLKDAAAVSHLVIKTLDHLQTSASEALAIAAETRSNKSGPLIPSDIDLDDLDLSSDSDMSDLSNGDQFMTKESNATVNEIHELGNAIKASIDRLFRISIFIRQASSEDRRSRARVKTAVFDSHYDTEYIRQKFPNIDQTGSTLASRLGEANARRRQFFKYCHDHDQRLAQGSNQEAKQDQAAAARRKNVTQGASGDAPTMAGAVTLHSAPTLAETEATRFKPKSFDPEIIENLVEQPARSVVSYATKIIDMDESGVGFPDIPEEGKEGDPFLCPYCFTAIQLERSRALQQWRRHVIKDLEPYICTSPLCEVKTFASQHAWFDHELSSHRYDFQCHCCGELGFVSAAEWMTHVQRLHRDEIVGTNLNTILQTCKRGKKYMSPSECPFCGSEPSWAIYDNAVMQKPSQNGDETLFVVTAQQLREHIAHHLLQIALFSLPRLLPDADAQQGVLSNAANDLQQDEAVYTTSSPSASGTNMSGHVASENPLNVPSDEMRVFGRSLQTLWTRDKLAVPIAVRCCIVFLRKTKNLEIQLGIPWLHQVYSGVLSEGSVGLMQKLDVATHVDAITMPDEIKEFLPLAESCAEVLKHFFVCLPDPLFEEKFYTDFINNAKLEDELQRRDGLHGIVNMMSDPHYATLRALAFYLSDMIAESHDKERVAFDLDLVVDSWEEPLMRANSEQMRRRFSENAWRDDRDWRRLALRTIIEHVHQIFDEEDEPV